VWASYLSPFYLDEFNTMIVWGRNIAISLKVHPTHVYQLMANEKGIVHWKVSVGQVFFNFLLA